MNLTVGDRVAQMVVKMYLEPRELNAKVEHRREVSLAQSLRIFLCIMHLTYG
ncbi:hypothetical protein D3C72_2568190 [compost metagenome]